MTTQANPTPKNPSWNDHVRQIEEECRLAFLAQDIDRLRQHWSDDLFVNSPMNRVNDRSQVLGLLERGVIRHESLEQHIEVISKHDDTIIVMGHDRVKNAPDGPVITRRFTNVWSLTDGALKLIARQATPIGESSAA